MSLDQHEVVDGIYQILNYSTGQKITAENLETILLVISGLRDPSKEVEKE